MRWALLLPLGLAACAQPSEPHVGVGVGVGPGGVGVHPGVSTRVGAARVGVGPHGASVGTGFGIGNLAIGLGSAL